MARVEFLQPARPHGHPSLGSRPVERARVGVPGWWAGLGPKSQPNPKPAGCNPARGHPNAESDRECQLILNITVKKARNVVTVLHQFTEQVDDGFEILDS